LTSMVLLAAWPVEKTHWLWESPHHLRDTCAPELPGGEMVAQGLGACLDAEPH